jgi:orotidine-5'-phosphate decarboxylase
MKRFSDRLVESIRKVGNPCIVGLDPRIDLMPVFVKEGRGRPTKKTVRSVIRDFHELVLDAVADLVPAVKPQLAFLEQYGSAASGRNAAVCFNADGLGAIVSSSRAITYAYPGKSVNSRTFAQYVRENTLRMIDDVTKSLTDAARVGMT